MSVPQLSSIVREHNSVVIIEGVCPVGGVSQGRETSRIALRMTMPLTVCFNFWSALNRPDSWIG